MISFIYGLRSGSDLCKITKEAWESAFVGFQSTSPELIQSRSLLRRADTKFLLNENSTLQVLSSLQHDYSILPAGDVFAATYKTLYFDTEYLDFYHAHRRGRRIRHKVRIRHYPDRNTAFLEVKKRINEYHQIKMREQRQLDDTVLTAHDITFIKTHTEEKNTLLPQAWMDFYRITLINNDANERVTIDFKLSLSTPNKTITIPGLVILETKQWPFCSRTPIMRVLKEEQCRPQRFSKYCAAIVLTRPNIRNNRLLPRFRKLKGGIF